MQDLLDLVAALFAAPGIGRDLRLIGGLAVRLHVGAAARSTRDVDVVAMTGDAERALTAQLERTGFVVGRAGLWTRGIRAGPPRQIVDLIGHPVVSPRTFEAATLQGPTVTADVAGTPVELASREDLARLKLLAARDQDLVDLLLLSSRLPLSAAAIARAAEHDDAERAVSAGAHVARHALASGRLSGAVEETLGRAADGHELAAVHGLLADLEKEGI